MTTPNIPTTAFGERITALDKHLAYVFSLDLRLDLESSAVRGARSAQRAGLCNRGRPEERALSRTYHVLSDTLVTTVDGVVRDSPRGSVASSDAILAADADGLVTLDGRVLLEFDDDIRATISMAYTGVVTIPGGAHRIFEWQEELEGAAFMSLRSECELSRYRWLAESQLFGFGRVRVHDAKEQDAARACTLDFSYDLYCAG